jgi:autotransporter-associated beta strand protein
VTLGSGTLTVGGAASTTFGGTISGTGNLTKSGLGTLTLSGTNTYTGSTNVLAGTLKAGGAPATNLVAFYDFNDPLGLGVDRSGSSNTATFTNAVASPGGNVGGALSLPGNAFMQLPDLTAMFGGQAGTLSIWTKLNVATPASSTLTGFANFGSGSNDHYPWTDGKAYQNVFRNNRVDLIDLDPTIDRTQWHLVTIVSDPTDLATGWRMYQNGTLIRTAAPSFAISGFQVGVQNSFFLNGFVDDVRLYNRALSTTEVQAIFNNNVIPDVSAVNVSAGATFDVAASETIGSLAGAGSVTLGSNSLYTGGNNSSTTFSGAISGTGSLNKMGSGTLTLNAVNTYSGPTNVTGGALTLGGTGSALNDATNVNVGAGATLNVSSGGEVVGNLAGAGTIVLNGALAANQTANTAFSGDIQGTGALTKFGTGTLTLSGNNT